MTTAELKYARLFYGAKHYDVDMTRLGTRGNRGGEVNMATRTSS